jgi:hypothetical protein
MRNKLIINLQQYPYFKWGAGLFAISFFFGVAANSIGYVLFLLLGLLSFTIRFKSYSKPILKEKGIKLQQAKYEMEIGVGATDVLFKIVDVS